jgi:hypothetical protein
MAISNWNAGIIRPIPVAPAGPYQDSAAPGVWTLDQVAYWQKQGLWPTAGNVAPTALFGGGNTGSNSSVIDYVSIATAGNATDFGDLTQTVSLLAGCSSSTRGLFGGGTTGVAYSNVIDYVTIGTLGNATDFGDLTVARGYVAALSNAIRGVWGGGDSGLRSSVIDYVTIASAGNATDFGDLILGLGTYMAGCASTTRGLFGGGNEGNVINIVVYITIASAGNAIDFGDLTVAREALAACSSAITGVFAGGKLAGTLYNVIDYVTIGTLGNATDFGDLTGTAGFRDICGTSSPTRGVFAGGYGGNTGSADITNIIQYITIASAGNAIDFGDLSVARESLAACSNAHGGL